VHSELPLAGAGGFEFPYPWDAKIIARSLDTVPEDIRRTLRAFGFDSASPVRGNSSATGAFVTYNVSITVTDRAMLNQLAYALSKVPGVRMVL